jgi:hypothetical protein
VGLPFFAANFGEVGGTMPCHGYDVINAAADWQINKGKVTTLPREVR